MRQIWRFVRVLAVTLVHTFVLSRAVRRVPPPERPRLRAERQRTGTQRLCEILGLHVDVVGAVPEARAMLMVSNHFGVLDPLVLASQLPIAFVGKAEIQSWPLVGWVTRTYGVIFVERERRSQTNAFIEQVQERLRDGVSVLVFPEGKTTRGRAVDPFKTGAFAAVADLEGGAVLPLYLDAVHVDGRPAEGEVRDLIEWAQSPQSFIEHFWQLTGLGSVHLQLRVGEPIPTAGRDRKDLAQRTHKEVAALAEPVRAEAS